MLNRKYKHIISVSGKKSGELLDIGAGTGYFVNYMNNKGFEAEGIEVDNDARLVAKENFGIELKSADAVYDLEKEKYDIITMWHVLEHIHDLNGYMQKIREALKPGGIFVCALPNFTSFDASHYRNNWAAYDVPRHLWHFSPQFFYNFAGAHFFEVIKKAPMPLDAIYISLLSEKIKKGSIIAGFIKGGWFAFKSFFKKDKASSIIYFMIKK
jgi:2-polyprenyl-3-methyl-5-hydroxy-6-metoxy-1,4-benzoquinol methylase